MNSFSNPESLFAYLRYAVVITYLIIAGGFIVSYVRYSDVMEGKLYYTISYLLVGGFFIFLAYQYEARLF